MKDFINIYIHKYPFEHEETKICEQRIKYMGENNNYNFDYNEKYYGWRLLERACKETLGCSIDSLNPRRLETGKWVIDKYYISISNSGTRVMVGISNKPIGVDIQKVREGQVNAVRKEMTKEEYKLYMKYYPYVWFVEHADVEAIYKCFNKGEKFIPTEINTLDYKDKLLSYQIEGYHYCFSICSELISKDVVPMINIDIENYEYSKVDYNKFKLQS